ncbi:SAM-dependent methyltransferase [Methanobrevibacter sp. DSM 116169]|uniref:SAM-dependent methyltransferase n=1 Tax=Methanobrevibacter sp. DSM 116169 TaxID=3242727 RepID=UPI0038FCFF80
MIKVSYDIEVYRNQLIESINPDDTVIEIGCHVGKTTEIITKKLKNGKLIAIDKSPESFNEINKLKNNFNNLEFIKADVRLHETLEEVYKKVSKCDLLLIDLGGGYHPDTVFKVYYIWSSTLKPKTTLIRNRGLVEFINSSKIEENFISESGYLESYEDQGIPPQIKEFNLWTSKLE